MNKLKSTASQENKLKIKNQEILKCINDLTIKTYADEGWNEVILMQKCMALHGLYIHKEMPQKTRSSKRHKMLT